MRNLLALLLAFLTLGVVDPPDEDPPVDDAADDPDLPSLDDDEPDPADNPDDPDPDDPETLRTQLQAERARAEKAERKAQEEVDRAAAERRANAPRPGPTEEEKLHQQEQAILDDPKSTEQQKYWANANRMLRANNRLAQEALHTSREQADRTEWERAKGSNPVLKKYDERVEKKLAEVRSGGGNLPRTVIAKLLIGEDIMSGKVKSTKRASADAGGGAPKQVERGKPASARSDVRSRGGQTEQDKRRARLANQII
jgi:flagellar biosynthesis GTPase FlhF